MNILQSGKGKGFLTALDSEGKPKGEPITFDVKGIARSTEQPSDNETINTRCELIFMKQYVDGFVVDKDGNVQRASVDHAFSINDLSVDKDGKLT